MAVANHPSIVMPRAEHPRPECVQMLEHEYALRTDLDATWAVRPLALVEHQGRTCLVLDDPGAELLAPRLGTPMELGLFLQVGVGLAAALGALPPRDHPQRPDAGSRDDRRGEGPSMVDGLSHRVSRAARAAEAGAD
jgi:hypothetical protein